MCQNSHPREGCSESTYLLCFHWFLPASIDFNWSTHDRFLWKKGDRKKYFLKTFRFIQKKITLLMDFIEKERYLSTLVLEIGLFFTIEHPFWVDSKNSVSASRNCSPWFPIFQAHCRTICPKWSSSQGNWGTFEKEEEKGLEDNFQVGPTTWANSYHQEEVAWWKEEPSNH